MNRRGLTQELLKRPLTRRCLLDIKTRAMRRHAWYPILDRLERGLVDLTIRWVDKVRNRTMARVLLRILEKLAHALERDMAQVLVVGRELAWKASESAVVWGNSQAYAWRFDK